MFIIKKKTVRLLNARQKTEMGKLFVGLSCLSPKSMSQTSEPLEGRCTYESDIDHILVCGITFVLHTDHL